MELTFTLNGVEKRLFSHPGENLRELLYRLGMLSVRDSDDGEGFAGSDLILVDGKPAYANLMIAAQAEGRTIRTAESLVKGKKLSIVQESMIDAGVVQSGYNSPAAALALADLLERSPDPSRAEVIDALSGIYNRATGYQQFFKAVELASRRMKDPGYTTQIAPEFREDLDVVGKVRKKVDGAKLVTARKAFVEDFVEQDACILKMLKSPHAHAYITSIDTSKAEALPGVVMVITYKNCPDVWYTFAGQGFPEPSPYDRRMFNQKLMHVGDRVAAVVAENGEIADKALGLIEVEYEVLEPVFTIEEAAAEGAPVIHGGTVEYVAGAPDELDSYNKGANPRDGKIIYQFPIHGDPRHNIAASVTGGIGDVDIGFAQADVVIDREYETSQVQQAPLETHVVYTQMDGERLVIHASTQVPWHLRRIVSTILGVSENQVRVIKERVGGGYGSKQDIVLEEVAAFATWSTGRSVFYHYTREEEFTSNSSRFPMKVRVKLGAKRDGTLTAVYMRVLANSGCFGNHCLTVPMNACSKSLPLVMCDNFKFDVITYYTNIPITGAYQGYGAPKGSFALQMALAELADELKMDHLKLVEKVRVKEGTMLEILRCLGEGREGTPAPVGSCGLGPALEEGADLIGWGKKDQPANPDVHIGQGLAIIQQGSGLPGLDHSCADVKMLADGSFMIHSGGADLGTGLDTVSVKVAAETLKVDMEQVSILSGDTDTTPFDTGAYASSGTFFSGNASLKAAVDLKEKILQVASRMLDEPVEELAVEKPGVVVGKKGKVSYREIAQETQAGLGSGQLVGYASFTSEDFAFPYGAHFCQVAVNTRTGEVKVQKYHALQDCGTPINPELALGQIYGGAFKSVAHSLWEEMVIDKEGVLTNPTLRDYGIPMITDLPEEFGAHLVFTDDAYGPFGGKSVSEISLNGASPALASAIHDAVGVWIRDWPFTPEKVLRALGKL
ncbi:molybdopterin-dependent oxidoreductase Mo/Fe-S-binding subunit [Sediminispirochaeta smaragdinae]|uniref:Selenate reductase, molybdenum-binding subunit n=1 Tax=Sediminispirochaeta smaragdinae (strain DSM 11293 / JCM 15392 / SEBR 4228) TaxID=573413 RepID=E1R499_SEDSS|nr:molybdopterin-dependent oxidoreductase Mo/Fe-S-binding subunit [Sediminispirochaeta smaragdinae]ADK80521.1 selenate reductase, molybdenum-binding subunit [Sediminispirochaeta smaragdinae DSM 11293]